MRMQLLVSSLLVSQLFSCGVLNKKDDDSLNGNDKPQNENTNSGGNENTDGGNSGSGSGGSITLVGLESIQGKWKEDCKAEDNASEQTTITFNGNQMTGVSVQYTDDNCSTPSISFERSSVVSIVGDAVKHTGGKLLTQTGSTYFMTVSYDVYIEAFNQGTFCGIADWKKGERRQVQVAENCVKESNNDISKPAVILVKGETLLTYDDDDQTSESFAGKKQ